MSRILNLRILKRCGDFIHSYVSNEIVNKNKHFCEEKLVIPRFWIREKTSDELVKSSRKFKKKNCEKMWCVVRKVVIGYEPSLVCSSFGVIPRDIRQVI